MNTYDPADYIVYVSMDRTLTPSVSPLPGICPENRLPSGYANESPRTRLRRGTAVRPSQSSVQPPLEEDADRATRGEAVRLLSANDVA